MMQAPFANAIFPLIYNYAIKLLIDLFAAKSQITLHSAIYPVLLFIGVNAWLEICWRIHNFAAWKSMPYIMQNVMNKVYNYVLNHSYRFFQNNLTGTITSKVKEHFMDIVFIAAIFVLGFASLAFIALCAKL